jgi:hypothetical protein
VTVNYGTANGSAQAGSDYSATSGSLTFAPGTTSERVNVTVNGDTDVEPDETFTLTLSAAANATLGKAVGTGTIRNDDTAAPPPPGKPDLVVTSVNPGGGESFNTCEVFFTVQNIGESPAGGSVTNVHGHVGVAGNASTNVSTPALAPGESVQQSATIGLACNNTAMTVTADTTSVVDEANEDNNVNGKTF